MRRECVCVRMYRLWRWWLLPVKNTYRRSSSEKWQERLLLPLSICSAVGVVDFFFINNYSIFHEKHKCFTYKQHSLTHSFAHVYVNLNVVPFMPCQSIDYVHRINGWFFATVSYLPFLSNEKRKSKQEEQQRLTVWRGENLSGFLKFGAFSQSEILQITCLPAIITLYLTRKKRQLEQNIWDALSILLNTAVKNYRF